MYQLKGKKDKPLSIQERTNLVPRVSLSPPPRARETLVWSGHVRTKIWDVANKRLVGGADECEFCLYLV